MTITRRHILAALPLTGAAALGLGFQHILSSMKTGQFDPRAIRSSGGAVPQFPPLSPLPGLQGTIEGIECTSLTQQNKPILLNFWASWCIPCVTELPLLSALAPSLTLWGIAYKDRPERASAFLTRNGQPFERVGQDKDGTAAIEWGVTGVPESILILPGGHVVWHHRAALTHEVITHDLLPLLRPFL